jgi:hypothetical protein
MGTPAWPLIDHHVHGVVGADVDRAGFELLITESGMPPAAGQSHFDSPLGLALRRWCAPVLDLPPLAPADSYLQRRLELGVGEVNRRLLCAAGLEALLVDTGHRSGEVASPAQMAGWSGAPAAEVVRIEPVVEAHAAASAGPAEFLTGLDAALAAAVHAGPEPVVGLKCVLAYRCGFDLDPAEPGPGELRSAADAWFRRDGGRGAPQVAAPAGEGGRWRFDSPVLYRHLLRRVGELAAADGLPLQFHSGFGDTDLDLHRADPVVFTPWVRRLGQAGVTTVFLHCYPYHRQAGYLAAVFPHVYFDVGCILNYAGAEAGRILAESLELAPFGKQLYSSDAFGLPELVFLGADVFRRELARILAGWVGAGVCTTRDAEHIRRLICADNARRLYPLDRLPARVPAVAPA